MAGARQMLGVAPGVPGVRKETLQQTLQAKEEEAGGIALLVQLQQMQQAEAEAEVGVTPQRKKLMPGVQQQM